MDHELQVGILDVDLCGPSVPYLLNLEGKDVHQSSEGYVVSIERQFVNNHTPLTNELKL